MPTLLRTHSDHPHFVELLKPLDAYLAEMDGSEHAFYAQYNKLDKIKHVVLVYENDLPIACGAIKEFSPGVMEIKRMYTSPAARGKGIATMVLRELETWTMELGATRCILETGKRQKEAIELYKKRNYVIIPNYGQYQGMENSLCFEKIL
jgi:putative acetyltransferase